jgi:hypothetical protein
MKKNFVKWNKKVLARIAGRLTEEQPNKIYFRFGFRSTIRDVVVKIVFSEYGTVTNEA